MHFTDTRSVFAFRLNINQPGFQDTFYCLQGKDTLLTLLDKW